ncbi:hypothetical protein [Iningainema tapete]|uniref:Uncharacterized protein n=1 Tax=Iningainema tapete BLCC-T55 TaxID=2748662 RepID=A0A8J7BXG5_9CYAN|nr:hypothetical protein [Iningainema tapete]MBD2773762.1 hypothetical protein [Iningainema tapete BLCC-T55]
MTRKGRQFIKPTPITTQPTFVDTPVETIRSGSTNWLSFPSGNKTDYLALDEIRRDAGTQPRAAIGRSDGGWATIRACYSFL